MARYRVDLHNHMPLAGADYRGPMETTGGEVVSAALAAGIDALGVTDHFALDFFHQVHAAAAGSPLLVLPGAELRLTWRGDEVHLIATFPPETAEEAFAELLARVGFRDEHRLCPPHRVALEQDPVEAVRLADRLGAMVHVAHADRRFGSYRLMGRALLQRLVEESPVAAVELMDRDSAAELGGLVERVALIQSSDSHHIEEIGRRRTEIDATALTFEGIRDVFVRVREGRS
jgi:hypothetical protein